jgi:hypothetical protein
MYLMISNMIFWATLALVDDWDLIQVQRGGLHAHAIWSVMLERVRSLRALPSWDLRVKTCNFKLPTLVCASSPFQQRK